MKMTKAVEWDTWKNTFISVYYNPKKRIAILTDWFNLYFILLTKEEATQFERYVECRAFRQMREYIKLNGTTSSI